jgi:transposase
MTRQQVSLFDGDSSGPQTVDSLIVMPQPDRPLTKAQRKFNRLVARIENLRATLDLETRRLDAALAYYGEHLYPRLQRLIALRKDFVRVVSRWFDHKSLRRGRNRDALRSFVGEQLNEIIEAEGALTDDDLQRMFELIHGVNLQDVERVELDEARSAMEAALSELGIDMDLSDLQLDMSEEALAAKAAEMAERIQQKAQEDEEAFRSTERPSTKRQLEKEERMRHAEEMRNKSIATIYKQLAKVLHPDLEPDATQKERKCALMQELTVAYHNNDLHTLLRLEIEWIQREQSGVDRLTGEKLGIYNQILKEQAEELEQELAALPYHPRYQPLLTPDGTFLFRWRTDGPAEADNLDKAIAGMEASLARMRSNPLKEIHAIIRAHAL